MESQAKFEREVRDKRAVALANGVIGKFSAQAKRVYDENIGGGIFSLYAEVKDGKLVKLHEENAPNSPERMWLMPNEIGGVTLMFPSDY